MAPAADLLVGKVLGDDGFGTASQVVDGMEWAVARGADVVNLSLGSDAPSDGTDPMSRALNELSASSGALFVVAAGNAGPAQGTIGSPAAADAALTVGAVGRDDSLADFSSRGPRAGDDAVKPDVTAPGVGIVAARAAGTTMGQVVDPSHVAASGTSMAALHVAGAAALLAQQHPDWTASRLKDALTSTARLIEGQRVTEQGGGCVDVAAASRTPVLATAGLALGTEDAVPLDVDHAGVVVGTDAAGPPDLHGATDRRILLALLVAGVVDKAVATQMGLSRRTVQSRIQRLMELAGATTRMQLAWQAARRGWL
ncbi:S8 family serine peptidase [Streptomyces albogriseolus]|uniref:S8 family serine peptidase n=1 Tax=Streptomyces albogriseolus TaxID=1887 RepID=UPI0037963304